MTDLNQLMVKLLQEWIENPPDEDARDAFYSAMKAEGWTPPPEKQEPKFKKGDYVEVYNPSKGRRDNPDPDTWVLQKWTDSHTRDNWTKDPDNVRHAESWLKPESGPEPEDSYGKYVYQTKDGRYWLEHNGKWYWLPFKD